jgi:hypothetical protein
MRDGQLLAALSYLTGSLPSVRLRRRNEKGLRNGAHLSIHPGSNWRISKNLSAWSEVVS